VRMVAARMSMSSMMELGNRRSASFRVFTYRIPIAILFLILPPQLCPVQLSGSLGALNSVIFSLEIREHDKATRRRRAGVMSVDMR
jgi:hypothetical protein